MNEQGAYQISVTSKLTTINSLICDDETNIPSTTTTKFKDITNTVLFPSLENIDGHDQSLHDIFQYLSEVPLHATLTPPSTTRPDDDDFPTSSLSTRTDDHYLDVSTSKESYFFQGYQNEGPEVKILDLDETHSKGKQHMEPGRMTIPNPQHDSLRRRSLKRTSETRRRQQVNEKLRAVQALIPNCDKAADHASILEQAVDYIRSMKLHIDVMSRSSGQSQLQSAYAPQMMMQPRMFQGIESRPWVSQMTPSGYPSMVQPVRVSCDGFPFQAIPQVQVQFTPVLCNPQFLTTPIRTSPTPVRPVTMPPVAPCQPQFTLPTSSDQVCSFQPPATG